MLPRIISEQNAAALVSSSSLLLFPPGNDTKRVASFAFKEVAIHSARAHGKLTLYAVNIWDARSGQLSFCLRVFVCACCLSTRMKGKGRSDVVEEEKRGAKYDDDGATVEVRLVGVCDATRVRGKDQ